LVSLQRAEDPMRLDLVFTRFATSIARVAGRPVAFIAALVFVVGWGIVGPIFRFSDSWQLVVNTGSSIITLLMVFLIQNTQNRESAALQAKLNELLQHLKADTRYIAIERLSQSEVEDAVKRSEARAAENSERKPDPS
jgi:low affinity Fe/Cu permease